MDSLLLLRFHGLIAIRGTESRSSSRATNSDVGGASRMRTEAEFLSSMMDGNLAQRRLFIIGFVLRDKNKSLCEQVTMAMYSIPCFHRIHNLGKRGCKWTPRKCRKDNTDSQK